MKSLILLLSFIVITPIFAENPLQEEMEANKNKYSESIFDQIIGFYHDGMKPNKHELNSVHTGRDYHAEKPNKARGQYLVCQDLETNKQHGPLFLNESFYCHNSGSDEYSPNIYDNANFFTLINKGKMSIKKKGRDLLVNLESSNNEVCNYEYANSICYKAYGDYIIYIVKKTNFQGSALFNKSKIERVGYFWKINL